MTFEKHRQGVTCEQAGQPSPLFYDCSLCPIKHNTSSVPMHAASHIASYSSLLNAA